MENIKREHPYQEIDIFDYLKVLFKYRKKIIRNVLVVVLIVAGVSFLLPKTYTAVATILPPEKDQSSSILTSLSDSPLSNLILSDKRTHSDLYVEILKSRSVFDGVLKTEFSYQKNQKKVRQQTLLQVFKVQNLETGRRKLAKKIQVKASPEGIIHIEAKFHDPSLAADVANALVIELDRINKEKNTSRAKNSRIYIANQLKLTEEKLRQASGDLVNFQEKYKAISLEEQTRAAIEKAGELKGQILAKNVELGVALQTMKPNNIIVVQLKREIEELEKQYNYLQYGDRVALKDQKEFYIPFAEVPEVGLELAKLMREVKVQETVWQLLNQQYYQARIEEARTTPTIQVLDDAVPPELPTSPKKKLLVLVGSFLALILSIFWAFIAESIQRLKSESFNYSTTKEISDDLKRDWETIKNYWSRIIQRMQIRRK